MIRLLYKFSARLKFHYWIVHKQHKYIVIKNPLSASKQPNLDIIEFDNYLRKHNYSFSMVAPNYRPDGTCKDFELYINKL